MKRPYTVTTNLHQIPQHQFWESLIGENEWLEEEEADNSPVTLLKFVSLVIYIAPCIYYDVT